eukprot:6489093-Amphidinium_carterae.1
MMRRGHQHTSIMLDFGDTYTLSNPLISFVARDLLQLCNNVDKDDTVPICGVLVLAQGYLDACAAVQPPASLSSLGGAWMGRADNGY